MSAGSAVDQRRASTLLRTIVEERSRGLHSSPIVACGIFLDSFDLLSAHAKPRISTRFTYPRGACPHPALDCNINNSPISGKLVQNSVGYTQPRGDDSPWKSPYPNGRIGATYVA
jgi:hypothetical protein